MSDFGTAALPLSIPHCETGIGKVVLKTASPDLISGVQITQSALWPDDRGYFLEVLRVGHGLPAAFDAATTQVSAALSYPGAIKAFHYHCHQTDCWVPVHGMFQVALVDLRKESPTFGCKNTMYAGTLRPWQILVPPGVAHGYKVIGNESGMLVYVTNRFYNPEDEGRVAHDNELIGYDWELQHK